MTAPGADTRSTNSTSVPSSTPSCTWWPSTACACSMNGIAASRRPRAGQARSASSHIRTPTRIRRSGSRASSPCDSSAAISRDSVAGCSRARRAICVTDSTVSSGVNASKMRTVRVSTDSPDADLAISR
jgi:hypothetical protein